MAFPPKPVFLATRQHPKAQHSRAELQSGAAAPRHSVVRLPVPQPAMLEALTGKRRAPAEGTKEES